MTRSLLDKRVKMLMMQLSEMGSLVEKQIYNSIEAFRNKDMELAKEITENDDKVDELNRKIEEQCLKLMAMESPVATDLRKIFTSSKITRLPALTPKFSIRVQHSFVQSLWELA